MDSRVSGSALARQELEVRRFWQVDPERLLLHMRVKVVYCDWADRLQLVYCRTPQGNRVVGINTNVDQSSRRYLAAYAAVGIVLSRMASYDPGLYVLIDADAQRDSLIAAWVRRFLMPEQAVRRVVPESAVSLAALFDVPLWAAVHRYRELAL